MFDIPPKSSPLEAHIDSEEKSRGSSKILEIKKQEEKLDKASEDIQRQMNVNEALLSDVKELKALDVPTVHVDDEVATDDVPVQSTLPWDDNLTNLSIGGLLSEISFMGLLSEASLMAKINNPDMKSENKSTLQPILLASADISIGGLFFEASLLSNKRKLDTQAMEGGFAQFQSAWDDNLTTLSVEGLLSEASLQTKAGCNPELKESKSNLHPNAPLFDSFDVFIVAQLNANTNMS